MRRCACGSHTTDTLPYSSWEEIFDSMSMSRNSLDSKISRQSRHSTYSASASRETTWTRGCKHCWSMDLLYKRLEVLSADRLMFTQLTPTVRGTGIVRYFRPAERVVKHFPQPE